MNEMLHSLSFFSAGAASALFSAIWEGAVLALGVYLCLRLLPGLSAAARSVVWLNVFILLVLLHFVPAFTGHAPDLTGGHVHPLHLGSALEPLSRRDMGRAFALEGGAVDSWDCAFEGPGPPRGSRRSRSATAGVASREPQWTSRPIVRV